MLDQEPNLAEDSGLLQPLNAALLHELSRLTVRVGLLDY